MTHPALRVVVAQEQWDETGHELRRRLDAMVSQGKLTAEQARLLHDGIEALIEDRVIEVVPREVYTHHEATARRRVPRDPDDWPPVALALTLQTGILTGDHDFLGCGCPTWTVETLRDELAAP
ncbi:MAG: PIN domain-containing protein [Nocardioidaceae bacterium]